MNHDWKTRVAMAFDRAVDHYDQFATVQQHVAGTLADTLRRTVPVAGVRDGLEIGCGTGFLTTFLLDRFRSAHWIISDLSGSMVERCRNRFAGEDHLARFVVMDGESLEPLDRDPDVIVSNLSFQWFEDLPGALSRILKRLRPSGWLCFTTLADDNFSELYRQFPEARLFERSRHGPDVSTLRRLLEQGGGGRISIEPLMVRQQYRSLGCFFDTLKKIGAETGKRHSSLSRSSLRQALRQSASSDQPVVADYRLLLAAVQKAPATGCDGQSTRNIQSGVSQESDDSTTSIVLGPSTSVESRG